jgi:hypothetical protein
MTTAIDKLITEALAIEAEAAKDAGELGFVARMMTLATLPHRKVEGAEFERRNGPFTLSITAPSRIGLPYGSLPRLILAWVTTEAVRTKSRELELGDSMSGFMAELGLVPTGGRWGSITRLKDQTARLFASSISTSYQEGPALAEMGYRLADKTVLWWDAKAPDQAGLWKSSVTLSEAFYGEIIARPVPVDMRALRALKRSPMALDVYTWLTYRMSYLKGETEIPWAALAAQFGADYRRARDFKAAFLTELRKVQTVYPEVRVNEGKLGLVLLPSPPHIDRST